MSKYMEKLQRARQGAASLGHVVRRVTEPEVDRLDIIAELGGEASAIEMVHHTGEGTPQNLNTRLRVLVRLGALKQEGSGKNGSPYRYSLTKVGELLRQNR